MAYTVQVFVLLTYFLNQATAVTVLSTMCPYTKFCTEGPQIKKNREQSCCRTCSCNDLCGVVGACCPDKVITHNESNYLYPCLTQQEIFSNYLNMTKDNSSPYKFRIITACHAHSTPEAIAQSHSAHCIQPDTMENLIFVTSTISGITYLNKHCAMCNGEYQYREWSLYLTDPIDFKSISSFESRKRVLNRGNVIAFPPSEDDLRQTMCPDFVRSKCNQTGLWYPYNKTIESKCGELNYHYYNLERGRIYIYKNVFCFMCNSPKNKLVKQNCKNLIMKNEFSYSKFTSRTTENYFLALLVQPKRQNSRQKTEEPLCNKSDVYDPFQERCAVLVCPPGFVTLNGKCEKLFDNISGLTTEVEFSFQLDKQFNVSKETLVSILDQLVSHVITFINDNDAYCDYCEASVVVLPEGDEFVLVMKIRSSHLCSYLHYIERLSKLYAASFSVYLNSHNITVELFGLYEPDYKFDESIWLVGSEQFKVCTSDVVYSNEIVFCPSIEVTVADTLALETLQQVKSDIINASNNVRNGTVTLCISDYLKIYSQVSVATPLELPSYLFILIIIISFNLLGVLFDFFASFTKTYIRSQRIIKIQTD